jgi:hypothetical protein
MSEPSSVGFGIIGSGMIGSVHATAIRAMRGGHLACVFNPNAASAAKLGAAHGVPAFSDWESFLSHPGLQAVTIAAPSGLHHECTLRAANAGKHVVCEKPLDVTLEKIDAMIRACAENKVLLAAIHQRRFLDSTRTFKQAIEAGRFGRITLADAYVKWFRTQQYYDQGAWRGTWKLDGGGALMNQSIHGIDALQWIAGATMADAGPGRGPIERVTALTAVRAHDPERLEVEDTCVGMLQFRDGALGQLLAATSLYPGHLRRLLFGGRDGTVVVEEEQLIAWQFRTDVADDAAVRERFGGASRTSGGAADPMAIDFSCHTRNFEQFVTALREGRRPMLDGIEGRKAVAIVEACYRSARTGRSAKVEDPA